MKKEQTIFDLPQEEIKSKKISAALKPSNYEKMKAAAQKNNVSMNQILNLLIEKYL